MGVATSSKITKVKPVLEAAKEVGRLMFFAAVAALVGWVSEKAAGLDPNSLYYLIAVAALRAIDKYVHVTDKTKMTGIAPF